MSQFPQPTRPIQSYDLAPIQLPQASQPVNENNMSAGSLDFLNNIMPQPTAATSEVESQAIEDLIRVISEDYEKLPESIRSQIDLGKFNVASSNHTTETGVQIESTTTIRGHHDHLLEEFKHKLERFKIRIVDINTSRGVNGPTQELRQKLERFKIRTVQLGEVSDPEVKR